MSPRELEWEVEAWQERSTRARKRLTELAWMTAALSRQKRLPALAGLLGEQAKPMSGKPDWRVMKAAMSGMPGVITTEAGRAQ